MEVYGYQTPLPAAISTKVFVTARSTKNCKHNKNDSSNYQLTSTRRCYVKKTFSDKEDNIEKFRKQKPFKESDDGVRAIAAPPPVDTRTLDREVCTLVDVLIDYDRQEGGLNLSIRYGDKKDFRWIIYCLNTSSSLFELLNEESEGLNKYFFHGQFASVFFNHHNKLTS
ncbi:hypothetical protein JTE90_014451 [Oedothorax gibbosus]|uniref:Uncharacterized protein n=1 Tax=Oedothorax gibbosus TaxID=931172 RepID=A0AAV6V0T8_9ARAC|nr:hypothetical protein JTE90_014451 [Oedothorax gibbosus]